MKKQLLSFILLIAVIISSAQSWRSEEMQIRIPVNNQNQVQKLAELKLNMDFNGPAYDHVIAYVVPKELDQIDALGFDYEIEIPDLNKHNLDFWQTKDAYHSYEEIIELADSLVTHFPDICQRIVYGMDASGVYELTALKISDNVSVDEPEAEVMFDGGIHGDEIGGAENVIRFARDLCIGYGEDPDIAFLIDNREIWLYLMVNPWGREYMSRYNINGIDLNRDWCYMWDAWGGSPGPCSQVESKALRECMYNNQFVIHTSYHSGTEYISCPWSYRPDVPHDMPHILQMAGLYASESGYSNMEYGQGFNGMYAINGSTKDSNYGMMGSIAWSMEISYDKQPPASQIMMYYNYNKPSMLAMIEYSGYGLEGFITDAVTGDPVQAVVFVNDYMPTFTDETAGDYHKFVLPGTYSITIVANGYATQTIENIEVGANMATATDFQLQPEEGQYVYRFSSSQIPENNYADEGWTPAVIGAPDDINYSIGKDGWCVLDMQYPVIDGPGIDFIVWEGDATPEGFTCYAGETLDGPWMSLGAGSGTTEFDMAGSGVTEARFIKIVDDGDGNANAADAGFDLDAIEALEPVSGIYIALYDYIIDDSQGNNNGRIDPGETVDIVVTLKNNGDIIAENTVGTISTSSPYITIDNASANYGNLEQGQSEEGTYTITANAGTPIGEPVALNLNVNAVSYNTTFMMSFSVGLIVEDWETGNFEQFDWETGGNANWAISTKILMRALIVLSLAILMMNSQHGCPFPMM
ncbi:MAG: M14 family zinc carboxypeptidase [Bacteroidales bacterium]